jgi:thiol-disulfide isomerase/thioredoxin
VITARPAALVGATILLAASIAPTAAKPNGPSLPWSRNFHDTLGDARSTGKPVVVSFVASWCPVCARMEREAWRDPAVLVLSDRFVWVTVDIDRRISVARELKVDAVPSVFVLDPEGRTRARLIGDADGSEVASYLDHALAGIRADPDGAPGEPSTQDEGARSDLIWRPGGYRSRSICYSNVGYGPLSIYAQSPFQALRLGIRPRTPSTLARGQYEFRGTLTWANTWAAGAVEDPDGTFTLDFETLQTTLALAYGITDTLEIEGEIQNRDRFGGVMDGFIEGFHDLFGINQAGRTRVPRDRFRFDLAIPGQPPVSLTNSDRGTFSRTLQLTLQHNVTCGVGAFPAFSYAFTTQWEGLDNSDLSGGSDVDFGFSAALSRGFKGKVFIYATLGYAWFGNDLFRGVEIRDSQASGLLAVEWRLKPRHSILVQYLVSQGQVNNLPPFDQSSHELTLGWKWEVRPRGVFEFGLIENIVLFDNSPDFGVHGGYSQRF